MLTGRGKTIRRATAAVAVVAVLAVLGFASYRYWLVPRAAVPAPAASTTQASATDSGSAPAHFPVPPSAAPTDARLPELDESDVALEDSLIDLLGRDAVRKLLVPDNYVSHFVATVDNLPRGRASSQLMPVRPVGGTLETSGSDQSLVLAPANAERYTPWITLINQLDTSKLVALYVHLYPLFQKAYQELGYPQGYFNDRLVVAIDDLLAAPEPDAPPRLVSAHVFFQFADADLEARSAGQKIMIRLGNENARAVKAKLRSIRLELTRSSPP